LGVKFATISIPSIDLKLPVYHGDTNKILRKGIGHYAGSYFPGENGTIILAGHNYESMFRNIDYIKKGEKITLKTTYGTFEYEVYDKKIVKATNLNAFKIQHETERLIIYSCYPLHQRTFFKSERYVVYAKKVSDNL
jgi:sortase A